MVSWHKDVPAIVFPTGSAPHIVSLRTIIWLICLLLAPLLLRFFFVQVAKLDKTTAGLAAYNLTALAPNLYLVCVGARAWMFEDLSNVSGTYAGRLYASLPAGENVHSVTIAYEAWNSVAAIAIPEYRSWAFVGHHAVTLYLAVLGTHPFAHYYALFFLGLASVSSVFLCVSDVFKHSAVLQEMAPTLALALRLCFALSFLAVRTCMWPVMSFRFIKDVLDACDAGVHYSQWVACVYIGANAFLTLLQGLWSWYIIRGIYKMFLPTSSDDSETMRKEKRR